MGSGSASVGLGLPAVGQGGDSQVSVGQVTPSSRVLYDKWAPEWGLKEPCVWRGWDTAGSTPLGHPFGPSAGLDTLPLNSPSKPGSHGGRAPRELIFTVGTGLAGCPRLCTDGASWVPGTPKPRTSLGLGLHVASHGDSPRGSARGHSRTGEATVCFPFLS